VVRVEADRGNSREGLPLSNLILLFFLSALGSFEKEGKLREGEMA